MPQPKLIAAAEEAALLYERDAALWSEKQAELLRQVAMGRAPAGIDWKNIIEEIESVGRSLTNAVESLLLQALVHEFKAKLWPRSSYVEHWRNESRLFQAQAAAQFVPSMRQRIDALKLLMRAARAVPETIDGARAKGDVEDLANAMLGQVDAWLADPDHARLWL